VVREFNIRDSSAGLLSGNHVREGRHLFVPFLRGLIAPRDLHGDGGRPVAQRDDNENENAICCRVGAAPCHGRFMRCRQTNNY